MQSMVFRDLKKRRVEIWLLEAIVIDRKKQKELKNCSTSDMTFLAFFGES